MPVHLATISAIFGADLFAQDRAVALQLGQPGVRRREVFSQFGQAPVPYFSEGFEIILAGGEGFFALCFLDLLLYGTDRVDGRFFVFPAQDLRAMLLLQPRQLLFDLLESLARLLVVFLFEHLGFDLEPRDAFFIFHQVGRVAVQLQFEFGRRFVD